jgi:hypothetical protein
MAATISMTPTREELLQALAVLSDENPELRLGPLVTNLATLARGAQVEAVWNCDDEEFGSWAPLGECPQGPQMNSTRQRGQGAESIASASGSCVTVSLRGRRRGVHQSGPLSRK